MTIRKATVEDIAILVQLRMDYLLDGGNAFDKRETTELKAKLLAYFERQLPVNGVIAVLAEEDGAVASAAYLSVAERPPRSVDGSCLVGTVYNVYTYPSHRRKGLATRVMDALLEEGRELGISSVDMLASPDGKPLYEKLGFQVSKYTPMRRKL